MIAPHAFALDDVDGHASFVDHVGSEDEARLDEAAHSCPEQAIQLIDESATSGQEVGG